MNRDAAALFAPFKLGDLELPNRIVMAPLTRNRAARDTDAPHDLNALYYRQRATAGLIISEATQISQQGQGYVWTPGLFSEPQVEGWRKVTDNVHAAGGRIFAAALARRPRLACRAAAERSGAGRALGDPGEDQDRFGRRLHRSLGAACAGD